MDIHTLTMFFLWCTIIDGAMFILAVIMCVIAPDFVYRVQSRFILIPRETFNVVIYSFLGLFKVFFLMFNVVPLVALLIVG